MRAIIPTFELNKPTDLDTQLYRDQTNIQFSAAAFSGTDYLSTSANTAVATQERVATTSTDADTTIPTSTVANTKTVPPITLSAELSLFQAEPLHPGPNEVAITPLAVGVNRADLLQASGHYPPPPGVTKVLGLECVGTISSLGEDVTNFTQGDQVCALVPGGAYSETVIARADALLPVPTINDFFCPANISPLTNLSHPILAATLLESACTAWHSLVEVGKLEPGQTVLIHGGSGGIGVFAVQLAVMLGARVITTAGSPSRARACEALGATKGIDYHDDVVSALMKATDDRGANIILDVTGAGGLETNTQMLAQGGHLVVIGLQRGTRGQIDLGKLIAKNANLHTTTLRSLPNKAKAKLIKQIEKHVWPLVSDGRIRPVLDSVFDISEVAAAHEHLRRGHPFGKVILRFS